MLPHETFWHFYLDGQVKKNQESSSPLLPYLLTPELLLKEIASKTEQFLYFEKHLKEIERVQENNLKKLLRGIIYLQMNNPLAANKEFFSILQSDPSELYFSQKNISNLDLRQHQHIFLNSFISYLGFIEEKVKEGPLADMLVTYIAEFYKDQEDEQEKLTDLRRNNFDKNFIYENSSSPVWGKEFIGFWSRQSKKVLSTVEFHQLFEKNLSDSRFNQQFNSLVWILQDFFPPHDEWRKIVIKKATAYQKSSDYYERYLFLNLLKNQSIKNQLLKIDSSLNTPVYQMERKFFKELLEKKIACDFALTELLRLGDEDELYRNQFKICP